MNSRRLKKVEEISWCHTWIITDGWEPISIYVEAVDQEGTGVRRTEMILSLDEPDPGAERPLTDYLMLTVHDEEA